MGLLSGLFGRNRADMKDAAQIYEKVMAQSRRPEFFGDGRFPDSYDGRIDLLTFNLSLIMKRLREFGKNGQILLREEGLSDKGVAKRIKPMIQLFYDRLKKYDAAVDEGTMVTILTESLGGEDMSVFADSVSLYGQRFFDSLSDLSLGEIARTKFIFPTLEK